MAVTDRAISVAQDIAEIHALIDAVAAGHRAKDAAAIAAAFTPDAVIADLAPPLMRRGIDQAATQAWLDGWDGPVEITSRDVAVEVDGDLALAHGLRHTQARTPSGEPAAWWSRFTLALVRAREGWRITHEHDSVPFHMDGSFRAAVDLEPQT